MRDWVASGIWNRPRRARVARERILLGRKLGHLKLAIARTPPFNEIVEANRFRESNQQIGKVVVMM